MPDSPAPKAAAQLLQQSCWKPRLHSWGCRHCLPGAHGTPAAMSITWVRARGSGPQHDHAHETNQRFAGLFTLQPAA